MQKQMNELLTKQFSPTFRVKSLEENGEIEGYASTFVSEPDSYGDVVVKGAFLDSISQHKAAGTMPKMFWQHDSHKPIGRWTDAKEDDYGLLLKGKLNMGVQQAREAYALLKEEDIDGLSIGYKIKKYSIDEEEGVWFLEKLDLIETSIVSIGANSTAVMTSVKSHKDIVSIKDKLIAGDQLTEREFEKLLKGYLGLSNSQAERAVRVNLKGQGDLVEANQAANFLTTLSKL